MQQAELLPRTCLVSLSAGVEKFFWYSFRSTEAAAGRESHFGIVRRDLTPKPAYHAYATLIRHLPNYSSRPRISSYGDLHLATWRKPDGTPVHAIWTARSKQLVTLQLSGIPTVATDYLGRSQSFVPERGQLYLNVSPRIQYLEGVETVSVFP